MSSSFDNRDDILTRYNYERERRRRTMQVQPATNAPIPPMLSSHEQVGTPNVNPFQNDFTPNTNTMSMQQIAGQVAPQPQQPFLERMARGAMSLPLGAAGLAEGLTTDPLSTIGNMGQAIGKHAAETVAIASDIPMNPVYGQRLALKGANALGVSGIGGIEPQLQQLQEERKQAYITNPLLAPLDVAGLAGTGALASTLPSLMSKIGRKSAVPKIIADAVAPEKPKVDVPEVVQQEMGTIGRTDNATNATQTTSNTNSGLGTSAEPLSDKMGIIPDNLKSGNLAKDVVVVNVVRRKSGIRGGGEVANLTDDLSANDFGNLRGALQKAYSDVGQPWDENSVRQTLDLLKHGDDLFEGTLPNGTTIILRSERHRNIAPYWTPEKHLADSRAGKISTEPTPPVTTPDAGAIPAQSIKTETPLGGAKEIKGELNTTKINHKQFKSEINDRLDKMIAEAPTLEENGVRTKLDNLSGYPNNSSNIANARDLTQYGINRVEIEIPGDGTFRIWNTKEHLEALKKLANRPKLPEEDAALRAFAPYNQGLSDQLARNAVKNAKREPKPIDVQSIELGALGTPSALHSTMGTIGQAATFPIEYIAKKIDDFMEKKGLANPFGTPEVVLKNTGIVEAFRDATAKEHTFVAEQSLKLKEILGDTITDEQALGDIFRHLDDEYAKLTPQEQALRGWFDDVRNKSNEFRVKRGDQPIGYIEGYVPHIWDKVRKFLDDDQSIALPHKSRNRFAETRVGVTGYEKDLVKALELYTRANARDMYINDALHSAIPAIEGLSKKGSKILHREVVTDPDGTTKYFNSYRLNNADMWSKRGYAEAFVREQLGLPTTGQRFLKQVGINPRTSQKWSNRATGLIYRNLLGAAIDTGVKNLSQITHTLAENGYAPTMKGIGRFLTPEGIKAARSEHLLKEFDAFLLTKDMPGVDKSKILKQFDDVVLSGPMRFTEFVNRGIAYHTALDDALKSGKAFAEAHDIALKAVRKTQFEYNKMGTSPFMRGPFTRPMAQFTTFPSKTSEMIFQWATEGPTGRAKLLRYFATTGALVYGGKELGIELGNIFFDPTKTVDPDSKGGFELPISGRKVKIDLTRLGSTGFAPQGFVPTVTKPYKYINDLMEKDRTAKERTVQAFREFVPGGRFGGKVYDVATGSEYRDERGRLIRKDTKSDAWLKLLGGRPSNQDIMRNKKEEIVKIEDEYYETRRKIIDTQLNGDIEEARQIIADFSKKYPYLASRLRKSLKQGRKDERKKKQMSSDERFMDNSMRQRIEQNL